MIKQFSFFSLLLLGLGFIMFSCNDKESVDPVEVESSKFQSPAGKFLKNYKYPGELMDVEEFLLGGSSACMPEVDSSCEIRANVRDTLTGDGPGYCQVVVQATISICDDEDGNSVVSFMHEFTEVLRPHPLDNSPTAGWCNDWFTENEAAFAAGNIDFVLERRDELVASAIEQFEGEFMRSYLEEADNLEMYPCGADETNPLTPAIRTEYYTATCSKICEVGGPLTPTWRIVGCGDGCCVKTREYCQKKKKDGGTVILSGPASYRQEEGLCADRQGELKCKPIIECASSTCPGDS